jgi:N4-gp56 family major capsid protein
MPSNPFELPIESTDPTVSFVPETTNEAQLTIGASDNPIPDSKIGSGKVTLSAKKLALRVGFSSELVEDSIIPILSIYREQAETAMFESIDFVLVNGDTTNAGTGNINSDDGDPADTQRYLAMDGLRHSALVEDTARRLDGAGAAVSLASLRDTRFKLPTTVSTKLSDLVIIAGVETYATLLDIDQVVTVDKYGPNATVLTGEIGRLDGVPIVVSSQFGLTEADGFASATPSNNTLGQLLYMYRPNWYLGYRRQMNIEVVYIPYFDAYQLVATIRFGIVHQDNDSVSVLYNLAV